MNDSPVLHVIDDDDEARDSLAFLLGTAGFVVASHESAIAFLAALPGIKPACIISDVRMPGMSGVELLQRMTKDRSTIPVIVISGHGDIPLAVEAMRLGAIDFLEKPFEEAAILAAVRRALDHGGKTGKSGVDSDEIHQRLNALSERERQVLDGLIAGKPNKTIAYDLGISPRTVEVYRANVMNKMQATSLSDLVRMAFVAGF